MKKLSFLYVSVGILFCFLLIIFFVSVSTNHGGNWQRNNQSSSNRRAMMDPQLEKTIQEWISTGAVHSVNIEFNQVRVDPVIWIRLPLENKQNFVAMFSKYFDSKGSTGHVEVLSNRNDKKLATYSVWSGIKIIE